jgi:glutamyl-tRNA reductase
MFMVDLAVPRDIEPEVGALGDVYLYTVDDLSAAVATAGEKRQAAVAQAEAIIDAGVQSFAHWLDQRASVPLIQAVNRQADGWRELELARARRMLARGESVDAVLDALARGLTHKLLHGAYAELHAADAAQRGQVEDAVARLFLRDGRSEPARSPERRS